MSLRLRYFFHLFVVVNLNENKVVHSAVELIIDMKIIPLLKIHHCFEGLIVFVIPTFEMLYRTLSVFNEPVIVFTRYPRYHKIGRPTKLSSSSIKTVRTSIEQPNSLTATWKNCNPISFTKHEQTNVFKLCSAPKSLPLGPKGCHSNNLPVLSVLSWLK